MHDIFPEKEIRNKNPVREDFIQHQHLCLRFVFLPIHILRQEIVFLGDAIFFQNRTELVAPVAQVGNGYDGFIVDINEIVEPRGF